VRSEQERAGGFPPARDEAALYARSFYGEILSLCLADVCGLKALGALDQIELDRVTLGEASEPLRLDRREMNENVLTTILRDEAKAFGVVKPLHGAFAHDTVLPFEVLPIRAAAPHFGLHKQKSREKLATTVELV
jgi:hypothetical protein